jgi:hypothetical protein
MKEGFISGQELLAERWTATDDGELLEIIKDGHEPKMLYTYKEPGIPKPYFFQVFHPSYKPIKIHGHRMLLPPPREADQVPLEVGEIEELFPFLHKCLFNIKQVEQIEELKPTLLNAKKPPEPQCHTASLVGKSPDDHIKQRKADGAKVEEIAVELRDQKGSFKLTYLDICRKLDLGKDLQPGQIDAMKKRAERACKKGKAMLTKNGKREKP